MPRNMALVGKSPGFVGFHIAQLERGDFLFGRIEHIFDHGAGKKFNFLVLLRPVEHDFGSAKLIAAMNQRHLGGEAGEEDRFLHGRVAAADDRDFLSGKKEAVAGGA